MYAVIETGGKQYRVAPGDKIRVESLPFQAGETVDLSGLLAVSNADGKMLTGDDAAKAKLSATVIGHGRGEKVIVFKFKRKKQYRRTQGHRQNYTEVRVADITV